MMSIEMANETIGTLEKEFKNLKAHIKMLKAEIQIVNHHNKELLENYHKLLAENSDLQDKLAEMS